LLSLRRLGFVPPAISSTIFKIQNEVTTTCWGYPHKSRMRHNFGDPSIFKKLSSRPHISRNFSILPLAGRY
ncbi:MAG: hypothetical protein SWC96_01105, partial [Thermodesulfobacteriota bacterium]|nr:hypothetical protein [Thermodesulfobacteriota bacterium]